MSETISAEDSEREICPCCLGTGFIDVMNADYETLDAEITEELRRL